jgi:hypothetical protein
LLQNLKARRLKIEMSNSSNDERRGRMGRMGDSRRDYGDDPERTNRSWRSAKTSDDGLGDDAGRDDRFRSRGGGFERSRDENRDSGFEDNKPGGWREGPRTTRSVGHECTHEITREFALRSLAIGIDEALARSRRASRYD